MLKTMIVKLLILPAVAGGGYIAGGGEIPALPSTDTTPVAVTPAPAQTPVGAIQVITTCDEPTRAAQAPGQARKASPSTVTVQVPQAPQSAPQSAAQAPAPAPKAEGTPAAAPTAQASSDGRVNLNTATAAELDALPNVGAKTAARILALQPRVTLEAVQAMPGMSPAHWAELAPHVTV